MLCVVPYSHAIYNGYWFSPERGSHAGLFRQVPGNRHGLGKKAKCVQGRRLAACPENHPTSLFSPKTWPHLKAAIMITGDAAGFIRLNGLRLGLYAQVKKA